MTSPDTTRTAYENEIRDMDRAEQIEALKGLLERVKAAESYDRELDAEIAEALGHEISWEQARYTMDQFPAIAWQEPHPYAGMREPCPEFTSSIDAALGLARPHLPRWSASIGLSEGYQHPCVVMGRSYPTNKRIAVEHRTAPLALCQAIVEAALASLPSEPTHTDTGGRS